MDDEKSMTPDKVKDDHTTPTKGKGAKDKKDDAKKGDKEKGRKGSAERKGNKGSRRNSMAPPSPPPGATTPISDGDALR